LKPTNSPHGDLTIIARLIADEIRRLAEACPDKPIEPEVPPSTSSRGREIRCTSEFPSAIPRRKK